MKLILTIVHDDDVEKVATALVANGIYVTRLASTGGFLRTGSTTLLSGVEDEQVDGMLQIVGSYAELRVGASTSQLLQETQAGRAVAFVLNLERFVRL